jgi:hypothetical protein
MPNYLKTPRIASSRPPGTRVKRPLHRNRGRRRRETSGYGRMRRSNAQRRCPPRRRARFADAQCRTAITEKLDADLSLQRIWQDLVEEYGYGASYESVKRSVRTSRRSDAPWACSTALSSYAARRRFPRAQYVSLPGLSSGSCAL